MSHPPGLFDIGRLARAVSWASGPVKAGGRAVEVQMSTGTEKGDDVTLESLCGSKNLWKAKVSVDPKKKERVLNKGRSGCRNGLRAAHRGFFLRFHSTQLGMAKTQRV